MKNITISLILFSLCMFKVNLIYSQWEFAGGVDSGVVPNSIGADGSRIILSCYPSTSIPMFYRSDDEGTTWEAIYVKDIKGEVESFAFKDDVIFAGGTGVSNINQVINFSVLVSKDGGYTWKPSGGEVIRDTVDLVFGTEDTYGTVFNFLVVGDSVFAGTRQGIALTTDDGDNWNYLSSGISKSTNVYDFTNHEGSLFAATSNGIYKSADSGKSWIISNNGVEENSKVESITSTAGVIIADGYRSTDNGETWQKLSKVPVGGTTPNVNLKGIYDMAVKEGFFIAAAYVPLNNSLEYGIYYSLDSGLTWSRSQDLSGEPQLISKGLENFIVKRVEYVSSTNYLFGRNIRTIGYFGRSLNGIEWTLPGLVKTVGPLASNDQYLFTIIENKFYRSSHANKNWEVILELPNDYYFDLVDDNKYLYNRLAKKSITVHDNRIFLISCKYKNLNSEQEHLYYSPDYGKSWDLYSLPDTISEFVVIDSLLLAKNLNNVYYRSVDHGQNWDIFTIDVVENLQGLIAENGILYAFDCNEVFKSTDLGQTWNFVTDVKEYFNMAANSFQFENDCLLNLNFKGDTIVFNSIRDQVSYQGNAYLLFYSLNGGLQLRRPENFGAANIGNIVATSIGFLGGNGRLFTKDGQVYETLEEGLGGEFGTKGIDLMTICNDTLYIQSVGGIWARSLESINPTVINIPTANKNAILNSPLRVFPIPTSDYLNVNQTPAPGEEFTVATLLNIEGQKIEEYELILGEKGFSVIIPVRALPSGVYFIKIISNKGSHLKRVVIKR